jgi:hypothetical protein
MREIKQKHPCGWRQELCETSGKNEPEAIGYVALWWRLFFVIHD